MIIINDNNNDNNNRSNNNNDSDDNNHDNNINIFYFLENGTAYNFSGNNTLGVFAKTSKM